MSDFSVTVADHEGDRAVIVVSGEIDMATASELDHVLSGLAAQGARRLVVDLSDVGFCDSTGLSTFVRARKQLADGEGAPIVLVGMTPPVVKVFRIAGLTGLFEHYGTLDAALTGVREEGGSGA